MSRQIPLTVYNASELVKQRDVKVGVAVNPDVTSQQGGFVALYFDKTIDYKRDFAIKGVVTINGEEVYHTPEFWYGLEAVELVIQSLSKLGVGEGVVTMTVTDRPIVLLPEKELKSWQRWSREYVHVPSNWYDVSTADGQQFLREEIELWNTPLEDRVVASDSYDDERAKYRFPEQIETHILFDSTRSPEDNLATIQSLLKRYEKEADVEIRELLGLPA